LHQGNKSIGDDHNCNANNDNIHLSLTLAEGEALLRKDLVKFESCVDNETPGLNSNQFSALVSFTFNLGCGVYRDSTLAKKIKAGDFNGAANEFGKFIHAGGRVSPVLIRRREAEKQLFLKAGLSVRGVAKNYISSSNCVTTCPP